MASQDSTREEDEEEEEPRKSVMPDGPAFDAAQAEQIKQGVDALVWFPWPADPDTKVCMKPLSREDLYRGASSAREYIREIGLEGEVNEVITLPDGSTKNVYWVELAQRDEWLAISLREGDDPSQPLFANANDLRAKLTPHEVNRLYEMLGDHMLRVMPMTMAQKLGEQEQYLKLLQHLKKSQGLMELGSLPLNILKELLIFTVEKLVP